MGWNGSEVMEQVRSHVQSVNEQEGLGLSLENLGEFRDVIGYLADEIAEKLNKVIDGETILRAWITGVMVLSYVRMRSVRMKKWKEAIQDVLEAVKCLFPIIDPRCN